MVRGVKLAARLGRRALQGQEPAENQRHSNWNTRKLQSLIAPRIKSTAPAIRSGHIRYAGQAGQPCCFLQRKYSRGTLSIKIQLLVLIPILRRRKYKSMSMADEEPIKHIPANRRSLAVNVASMSF